MKSKIVLWPKKSKKKRKSNLAKQKYKYEGLDPFEAAENRRRGALKKGQILQDAGIDTVESEGRFGRYEADPHGAAAKADYLRDQGRENKTERILESEGIDTIYRRKPSKVKTKKSQRRITWWSTRTPTKHKRNINW